MKGNKELKDLLTTGVIVEVCNEIEGEDTIKYIGVVMGNTILYDNGYDLATAIKVIIFKVAVIINSYLMKFAKK